MLDPSGRAEVLATVRKLNREKGMTVVWITHYMEEAAVADRLVVMDDGTVGDGTARHGGVLPSGGDLRRWGWTCRPWPSWPRTAAGSGACPCPDGILTVSDMVKELKDVLCPSK